MSGFDAGGFLQGGQLVISYATMAPVPQLTPEQRAAYIRAFELARRWHARDTD